MADKEFMQPHGSMTMEHCAQEVLQHSEHLGGVSCAIVDALGTIEATARHGHRHKQDSPHITTDDARLLVQNRDMKESGKFKLNFAGESFDCEKVRGNLFGHGSRHHLGCFSEDGGRYFIIVIGNNSLRDDRFEKDMNSLFFQYKDVLQPTQPPLTERVKEMVIGTQDSGIKHMHERNESAKSKEKVGEAQESDKQATSSQSQQPTFGQKIKQGLNVIGEKLSGKSSEGGEYGSEKPYQEGGEYTSEKPYQEGTGYVHGGPEYTGTGLSEKRSGISEGFTQPGPTMGMGAVSTTTTTSTTKTGTGEAMKHTSGETF
jgi:hypothetical protein